MLFRFFHVAVDSVRPCSFRDDKEAPLAQNHQVFCAGK
jgi:hypothetical protein